LVASVHSVAGFAQDQHSLAREDLRTLLGYMTTYFPFRPNTNTNRDIKVHSIVLWFGLCLLTNVSSSKVEQSIQDLNLIYCELTSLLVLVSHTRSNNSRTNRGQSRQTQNATQASEGVLLLQAERVSQYVIQLLRGEALSGSQIGRLLTPTAYIALLPTIWSLLNQPSPNEHRIRSNVLLAILEHATKTSSNSPVKKLGIEFVARLVIVSLLFL
jgi:pre-rRNA-processing protein IPI1